MYILYGKNRIRKRKLCILVLHNREAEASTTLPLAKRTPKYVIFVDKEKKAWNILFPFLFEK